MVEATQRLSVFSDEDDEPEETREQLAYFASKVRSPAPSLTFSGLR